MAVEASASNYSQRITSVFNQGSNALSYPSHNLANQLKTVARLISGGCKTKIFLVYRTGFDTHANQISRHTNLLTELSQSIKAFQDDLAALGLSDRVTTVTMSEFGRKAFENGNAGTDHGTLNNMFVFGSALKGGVYGTNLDLSVLDDGAPLNFQYDYRQVLTTLLQDWLGADTAALTAAKFEAFETQKLDLIQDSQVADDDFVCPADGQHVGEVGFIPATLQPDANTWHTQTLTHSYTNPVVVMGPSSNAGAQALTIRVRNVTSNSFEWQVDEWDYLDGYHLAIDISYAVVEAGIYELESGKKLMAGIAPAVTNVFGTVSFPDTFSNTPVVLAQVTTVNEVSAVVCRMRDIEDSQFSLKVQEEEANDGTHAGESVAWITIEAGAFDSDTLKGEAGSTGVSVGITDYPITFGRTYSNSPVFLANIQTNVGGNPVNVRYRNLTPTDVQVYLQEEQSQDTEVGHVAEEVGFAVFDQVGNLWGYPVSGSQPRQAEESLFALREAFSIHCYPNPFINKFIIEPKHTTSKDLIVEITDIHGRVVFHQSGYPGDQLITIPAGRFGAGTYSVRVVAGDEVAMFRVLKT